MGVRGGAAEEASVALATQDVLPGGEAAAELARTLDQIAQEDPDGAASLRASLGLQSAAAAAPSAPVSGSGRSGGLESAAHFMGLVEDASEDFEVDVTLTAVVVGSRRVGKTALIRHFVRGTFSETYQRSIATDFLEKRASLLIGHTEEEEVTFHIWDSPGGDEPMAFVQNSCRKAQAYIIAFSTDDRASFEMVEGWVAAIRTKYGPNVLLILAQTKSDLEGASHDGPPREEIEALARRLELRHCSSSAQSGVGTTETFKTLGIELLARARLAEEEFRAGKALGGLQWESAPAGGRPAVWAESVADGVASDQIAAASSGSGMAEAVIAPEADADDADEDEGLPLPGL